MFPLTDDQQLFEATTAQFLAARYPPETIRGLREKTSVFDAATWSQGAQLGWTSLLVPEADGGGSISGNGLLDLLIVAYHFGRRAAPGTSAGDERVALALARWGTPEQRHGPLADLLSGASCAPGRVPLRASASPFRGRRRARRHVAVRRIRGGRRLPARFGRGGRS